MKSGPWRTMIRLVLISMQRVRRWKREEYQNSDSRDLAARTVASSSTAAVTITTSPVAESPIDPGQIRLGLETGEIVTHRRCMTRDSFCPGFCVADFPERPALRFTQSISLGRMITEPQNRCPDRETGVSTCSFRRFSLAASANYELIYAHLVTTNNKCQEK